MERVAIESGNLNVLGYTIQLAISAPLLLLAQMSQACNSTIFHRDIFIFEKKVYGKSASQLSSDASVASLEFFSCAVQVASWMDSLGKGVLVAGGVTGLPSPAFHC